MKTTPTNQTSQSGKVLWSGLNPQLHRFAGIYGMAMLMCIATTVSAKNLVWQSTSSTDWATAANWYDTGAAATSTTSPSNTDAVTIDNSQGATAQPILTETNQVCVSLVVGNGFTLTISGSSSSLKVGHSVAGNNDIEIQKWGAIITSGQPPISTPLLVLLAPRYV